MKVFFTSDLHFGHESLLKRFEFRPFQTVEEMDEELIRRWNEKVGKDDLVYVLGDFFMKGNPEYVRSILKRLKGQIILIKGNHDHWLHNAGNKKFLAGIKDYDEIWVTLENGSVKRCILSHYFMPFYNSHYRYSIHLHGHSHTTKEAEEERKIAEYLNKEGYTNEIYNVGCMYYDYEPVTLDEIIRKNRGR